MSQLSSSQRVITRTIWKKVIVRWNSYWICTKSVPLIFSSSLEPDSWYYKCNPNGAGIKVIGISAMNWVYVRIAQATMSLCFTWSISRSTSNYTPWSSCTSSTILSLSAVAKIQILNGDIVSRRVWLMANGLTCQESSHWTHQLQPYFSATP